MEPIGTICIDFLQTGLEDKAGLPAVLKGKASSGPDRYRVALGA